MDNVYIYFFSSLFIKLLQYIKHYQCSIWFYSLITNYAVNNKYDSFLFFNAMTVNRWFFKSFFFLFLCFFFWRWTVEIWNETSFLSENIKWKVANVQFLICILSQQYQIYPSSHKACFCKDWLPFFFNEAFAIYVTFIVKWMLGILNHGKKMRKWFKIYIHVLYFMQTVLWLEGSIS